MRAVVYDAVGAVPELRDVPAPDCPPDGVVVTVGATGVCRSDWHAWRGHDPVALPHIPGHELAGTVAAAGPGVTRFTVGDRVTTPFVNGCGRCPLCRAGDPQVCPDQTQPGFTGPGSFAEQVALHAADTNLVRLPDAIGFVDAAALGCRFATAYRGLTAHARLHPGQWLAVHGCGGVGLSAVAIGAALGARVVAVDLSEAALDRARSLGAEAVVRGLDPVKDIRALTGGGAHASVDALGSPATAAASVRSLRRRGRHVQIGLLLDPAGTALPMDVVVAHELEIYGCHGLAAADYPPMLALVASGAVRLSNLVGAVIGLDEAPAALMAMDQLTGAASGMTVVDLGREGGSGIFGDMSQPTASDPTSPGPVPSGATVPGSTDEPAFSDENLQPEEDPGLHHVRSESRGMPLRPDDDELAAAAERDRVAAGLADYAPGDVPPATDPLPEGTDPAVDLAQRGLLGDTSVDDGED